MHTIELNNRAFQEKKIKQKHVQEKKLIVCGDELHLILCEVD